MSCGGESGDASPQLSEIASPLIDFPAFPDGDIMAMLDTVAAENPWDRHLDSLPQTDLVKLRVVPVGRLATVFSDLNDQHLKAAKALGISPIDSEQDILYASRPLARVESCREYYIDDLTHSYPYLVPEAASLLREIGARFCDSLQARGGGAYRIKVTSLLRTPGTVHRLRRVNRNSTEASAHQYATTFDISYSKFVCDNDSTGRTVEDLKNLLAEILYDLRADGRCLIKYERKQGCFHITTCPLSPGTKPAKI